MEKLYSLARKSSCELWTCRWSNNFAMNWFYYLPSINLVPTSSKGFFTSLSFTYLLTDFLKVFLGLSSSVFSLENETSDSMFFMTVLFQALLYTMSLKSDITSFYLLIIYQMNLLKSWLLFLDSKLQISSMTSPTCWHFKLLNSPLDKAKMVSNFLSSLVIPFNIIFLTIF